MKLGLVIYGSLETLSGGYLYDRKLIASLRALGDSVEIVSLPWRNYLAHLTDNLRFRLPSGLDLLIQDELNHPSLICANRRPHPYPIVGLVHHLRASEPHPAWLNRLYRAVERRYLESVDGFIFNSNTTRHVVHGLVGPGRPHLVANPPTDRFGKGPGERQVWARARHSGPLRAVFLGNVIPRKGLHTLLEALKLEKVDARLDVAGSLSVDPAYAQRMQNVVERAGLGSQVTFHDALAQKPLARLLRNSQVLAVPSAYEGFGIVYLEGMAFGLPAIGTTAGAAGEIIQDGQNGYLIPPGDAVSLAKRLQGLADERDLLARLSLNALKRYKDQPTWEQSAKRIRLFLMNLVDRA